jgi:histone-lysine N-methyltransferase SETD2
MSPPYILTLPQETDEPIQTTTVADEDFSLPDSPPQKRRYLEPRFSVKPLGFAPTSIVHVQEWKEPGPYDRSVRRLKAVETSRQSIAAIIAAATAAAATAAAATSAETPTDAPGVDNTSRKSSKSSKKHRTKEEKEGIKEKRLMKLVGAIVVKCMSKYRHEMDHDVFKKHAKEVSVPMERICLG